jgi:Flp pilus assembly protein TadD
MSLKRHLSYAQGYLELGLITEAVEELDRISEPDCFSSPVLAVKMAVLHEQKDWRKLAAVAAELAERTPDDAAVWVTWAYAVRRSETLAAAERILLRAEKHHPHEPTIQFNLGCYACLRGDLATAKRRVDRAIAIEPRFTDAAATDPDLAALREAEAGEKP